MPLCLLGLGSNLGDSARLLDDALSRLAAHPQMELLRQSRFHETSPAGGPAGQANYLNAAALVRTSLAPHELLRTCQAIENDFGRRRTEHWGPRTIDIDVLLYDELVLRSTELQIPHPRMAWRRFTIEPAAEIAAEMVHPVIGWTIGRLLEHLNTTPWYLAIAGPIASGKSCLAAEVTRRVDARLLAEHSDPALLEVFYRNPSGHAWQIELEFLRQRARQLDRGDPGWTRVDQPTVSDFWFEQSAAIASVLLSAGQYAEYMVRWSDLSLHVARPRLVVLVSAPMETLLARIRDRRRPGEEEPTIEQLERIAAALDERAAGSEGPVLRLDAFDLPKALVELTAAVAAMR